VRQAAGEAREYFVVDLLAAVDDRRARAFDELVEVPFVNGNADDRAIEQLALFEAVQRMEGHHLGEGAGEAEDQENVGAVRHVSTLARQTTGRKVLDEAHSME